jgi:hypothetical protein
MLQCIGRDWHIASIRTHALNGRYRRHSDHFSMLARNGSVAIDPKRTLAVRQPIRGFSHLALRCGINRSPAMVSTKRGHRLVIIKLFGPADFVRALLLCEGAVCLLLPLAGRMME